MSADNVLPFLRMLADRTDLLDQLRAQPKDEVIAAATELGFPFSEAEFNALVWDLEGQLATERKEQFDAHFPLWQTLWGAYYLEFLVHDLVPSLTETGLA